MSERIFFFLGKGSPTKEMESLAKDVMTGKTRTGSGGQILAL